MVHAAAPLHSVRPPLLGRPSFWCRRYFCFFLSAVFTARIDVGSWRWWLVLWYGQLLPAGLLSVGRSVRRPSRLWGVASLFKHTIKLDTHVYIYSPARGVGTQDKTATRPHRPRLHTAMLVNQLQQKKWIELNTCLIYFETLSSLGENTWSSVGRNPPKSAFPLFEFQ